MDRTRGKVFGVSRRLQFGLTAVAASGLLAACGGNDSTASSTPTLTPTTSAAAVSSSAAPSEAPSSTETSSEAAPAPSTELERPQPVPTESAAPADSSNLTDKDKKFLDALKAEGVVPSSPDIALSIGTYVCQGVAAGATEADMTTFVNAMAGSDPSFDAGKMSVEDAGKKYMSAAKSTYCQ
ncbi:DUF732 domain-containing protein [Nocardia goodfellowii]|uniref:DUF732 domain-containing protein n=1 Tax=Nocardia goodfellowii TaxID=882446 RepID=A0ABS4Q8S4_9NOCA|nr:DUF732 domain-containing protein [Nocardia goodfellowii]MBP2188086.1 hypothetical protein [Nocardia goodfellowii]